jgi:hypothetical protein
MDPGALDQMVFARRALHAYARKAHTRLGPGFGAPRGRRGPAAALPAAREHAELVRQERALAEEAADFLETWARGRVPQAAPGGAGCRKQGAEKPGQIRSPGRGREGERRNRRRPAGRRIGPREAARAVGATPRQIRNWERNRLLRTPRDANGRRSYGPAELGRLRVIRSLLLAGYSVMAVLG